jgi:hypothetical protein
MRWLHLEGLDRLTILKFAVKYSLHPLCVEDALKLDEQQPKVRTIYSAIPIPTSRPLTPSSTIV